ncbi:MAG: hypothetical protein K8I30_10480 [Anaerolineae bacterium]|nr:hypothetical protein [Anaerolineae bacterium]
MTKFPFSRRSALNAADTLWVPPLLPWIRQHRAFILCAVLMISLALPAFAQSESTGVVVTADPVIVDAADYSGTLAYETPTLPAEWGVPEGDSPRYELHLTPLALFQERCTYNYAFHVWRFQGRVTATLTDLTTGEPLATQVFDAESPPACEAKLGVTQMGTRLTWPDAVAISQWAVGALGNVGESGSAVTLLPINAETFDRLSLMVPLVGHTHSVDSLLFCPDGTVLVSGGGTYEPTVRLWDTVTGEALAAVAVTDDPNGNTVQALALSHDCALLAASAGPFSPRLRVWDVATGQLIHEFTDVGSYVFNLAFSPDNAILAITVNNDIQLRDVHTGQTVGQMSGNAVGDMMFSADGSSLFMAGGSPAVVRSWAAASGSLLSEMTLPDDAILATLSPDRQRVAFVVDRVIYVWDALTGSEVGAFAGHTGDIRSLGFSGDGRVLVSGGIDNSARLWDIATGTSRTLESDAWVMSTAISPDGTLLAVGGGDSSLSLWGAQDIGR